MNDGTDLGASGGLSGGNSGGSGGCVPPRTPLDVDAVNARVRPLGLRVESVAQTGSTNTDLSGRAGSADGTVLCAEEQVAGRGRMGRAWTAPASSQLIVSVSLTCPDVPAERLGLVPLLAGLSIAQGINDATSLQATLKWPNDVLVDGRKLVGVLVEAAEVQPTPRLVVGFGVNYDLTRDELPVPHATSLALEIAGAGAGATGAGAVGVDSAGVAGAGAVGDDSAGATGVLPSREDVLVRILTQLAEDVQRFRSLGGAPMTFMSRYKKLSATLGRSVKVMLPGDRELLGEAVDISDAGELVVRATDGTVHSVAAGDVIHVRPQAGGYAGQ